MFLVFITTSSMAFAADQVPFASDITSVVKNYNRATPLLATSGRLGEGAVKELAQKGITTIIDLRGVEEGSTQEKALAEQNSVTYINIPVNGMTVTDDKILADLTKILDEINTPTLLHCGSGNRVGALLTQYYLNKGQSKDVAFEKGRTAGMKPSLEGICL